VKKQKIENWHTAESFSGNRSESNDNSCKYEPVETSIFCESAKNVLLARTTASAKSNSASVQLREGIQLFFTPISLCKADKEEEIIHRLTFM
jgi:hypothetical protein